MYGSCAVASASAIGAFGSIRPRSSQRRAASTEHGRRTISFNPKPVHIPNPAWPRLARDDTEGEGFEPSVRRSRTTVFETAPFNHSGTPPGTRLGDGEG